MAFTGLGSLVCLVGGLAALWLGITSARERLTRIQRACRCQQHVLSEMPDEWRQWFFQGFVDVTVGVRGLFAVVVLALWTALAVGLAGIALFHVL